MSANLRLNVPLAPKDAVAALIVLDDGRYLMQQRDDIPGIFYPGYWGLFGGAIEQLTDDDLAQLAAHPLGAHHSRFGIHAAVGNAWSSTCGWCPVGAQRVLIAGIGEPHF